MSAATTTAARPPRWDPARFRHDDTCAGPKLQGKRGREDGLPLLICRGCGRLASVESLRPRPPKVDPGYRCPVHQHRPVRMDTHGHARGCPDCAREHREARDRRRRARAEAGDEP